MIFSSVNTKQKNAAAQKCSMFKPNGSAGGKKIDFVNCHPIT